MKFAFEVSFEQVREDLDGLVDSVFSSLESEFLVLPRGMGFVEYSVFEQGYEALKRVTGDFADLSAAKLAQAVFEVPIAFIVLRSILGFTPSEWAYLASRRTGMTVSQTFARNVDRGIRLAPAKPLSDKGVNGERILALVRAAGELLEEGAPSVAPDRIHRLDKADTRSGTAALRRMADMGAPYAMLLYERFLGRPFAGHRDSVSEIVGDSLESAVEEVLTREGVSYRKTKRAERLPGFDQAPDFIVPSEFNPQALIEAKLTEDDGTARDKVTRVQHLSALSLAGQPPDRPRYEVIACIAGRGFGVRREDMRKLLLATRGKVFTPRSLDRMVECTRLRELKTR